MERNELQSRFDQLAQQRGTDLSSENVDEINQHFLVANEDLKEKNNVRQHSWSAYMTDFQVFSPVI